MYVSSRILFYLLIPVFLFPVGIAFLLVFGRIFAMLGDTFSGRILDWIAFFLAFLWFMDTVTLVIALTVKTIMEQTNTDSDEQTFQK